MIPSMTIAPYQLLIYWWPVFVDVFLACLLAHIFFYFYLWFIGECKAKWLKRRNKIVSIKIIPGSPRDISENRML